MMFAIYMLYRWLYGYPFFWTLGHQAHPEDHFSLPRWFLLAVLEARVLLAATHLARSRLPACAKWVAECALWVQITFLTAMGMCWRDYYHSPWFNLCNKDYHTEVSARVRGARTLRAPPTTLLGALAVGH